MHDMTPAEASARMVRGIVDLYNRVLDANPRATRGRDLERTRAPTGVHPLWSEVKLPGGERVYWNSTTGATSRVPVRPRAEVSGGILADEMGTTRSVSSHCVGARAERAPCSVSRLATNLTTAHPWCRRAWQDPGGGWAGALEPHVPASDAAEPLLRRLPARRAGQRCIDAAAGRPARQPSREALPGRHGVLRRPQHSDRDTHDHQ